MTNKAPESSIINDAFLKFKRGVKYIGTDNSTLYTPKHTLSLQKYKYTFSYLEVLFKSTEKETNLGTKILSCVKENYKLEPFSMATDKSQGLPVQPTEIEGINNEAQAAGGRTEQL